MAEAVKIRSARSIRKLFSVLLETYELSDPFGEIQVRSFRGLPPRTTSASSFELRLQRVFLQQSTHRQ